MTKKKDLYIMLFSNEASPAIFNFLAHRDNALHLLALNIVFRTALKYQLLLSLSQLNQCYRAVPSPRAQRYFRFLSIIFDNISILSLHLLTFDVLTS